MVIILKANASPQQIEETVQCVKALGLVPHLSRGQEQTIIGLVGNARQADTSRLLSFSWVDRLVPIQRPYKLASRAVAPTGTVVTIGPGVAVGGNRLAVAAGPCAVECYVQLKETALALREAGACLLRGGAFKPRTSPYSFQGLGEQGLEILARVGEETGLPVVTEVMEPQMVPLVARYAQVLQIGARNMQNFPLLQAAGQCGKPVLLKRGMSSTVEEWLMAAEYILAAGNRNVMLCERGIRTFETATRNTLDINAVPLLKQLTHLPVLVDPSHATGKWDLVEPVSLAAVGAGADGLLIEVHPRPLEAVSDGEQSLKPEKFLRLMQTLRKVAEALDRQV